MQTTYRSVPDGLDSAYTAPVLPSQTGPYGRMQGCQAKTQTAGWDGETITAAKDLKPAWIPRRFLCI